MLDYINDLYRHDLAHFAGRAAFSHEVRLGMALVCRGMSGL